MYICKFYILPKNYQSGGIGRHNRLKICLLPVQFRRLVICRLKYITVIKIISK